MVVGLHHGGRRDGDVKSGEAPSWRSERGVNPGSFSHSCSRRGVRELRCRMPERGKLDSKEEEVKK